LLALRAEVASQDRPEFKLAVTLTPKDIKFSATIPGDHVPNGQPRPSVWCELYYDPASDSQILLNRRENENPITLVRLSLPDVSPADEYQIDRGYPKALSLGTWRIKVKGVPVLEFQILDKRAAALGYSVSPVSPQGDAPAALSATAATATAIE